MNTPEQPKSTYGGDRGGGGTTKTRRAARTTTHASVAAASHTPGVREHSRLHGQSRRHHARVGRRSLAHPWCLRGGPLASGPYARGGGNAHPSGAARLRPLALRRPRSGRPHARPHAHASHSHATPCQDCPATHAHTLCRHGTHCVRLRHPLTLRQTPQRWQSHRRGASLEAGSRG